MQRLKLENLSAALPKAGLSQAALAERLGVSREAVSKWFSGRAIPRPDKLLQLALATGLAFEQLVQDDSLPSEPVVAFRKRGARKITDVHIARAKDMGRALRALVPYLPFDRLTQPPRLKQPVRDYEYLQAVSRQLRTEIGIGEDGVIEVEHLVGRFTALQAVLIPVLWGEKDGHDNALHIYLPDSMTTWVYLNLDTSPVDFKFWMAHELGHVYGAALTGDDAEDFSDSFAGAILFPEAPAADAYRQLMQKRLPASRLGVLQRHASAFGVSPITVCHEVRNYAVAHKLECPTVGDELYRSTHAFKKPHGTIAGKLLEGASPSARDFVGRTSQLLRTPFFDALRRYLAEHPKSVGFIQAITDVPVLDAKELLTELS